MRLMPLQFSLAPGRRIFFSPKVILPRATIYLATAHTRGNPVTLSREKKGLKAAIEHRLLAKITSVTMTAI